MTADRVRLRDLLRGVASTLPDFATTQRGLWNLIRYKPDTNLSIGLRFAQLAAAQPQAPALRFEAQTWTYAEVKSGRAACRERVCKYVYISVVAVSFKKKKHRHTTRMRVDCKTYT